MLKKVMLYLMMLLTICRFLVLTFVFSTDINRLPVAVYISTGVVIILGILLICKNIIKSVSKRELAIFYGLSAASVLFNIVFMKLFSRAELTALDFLVIGTIMDLLVYAVLIVLTVRETKYIRIQMKTDA